MSLPYGIIEALTGVIGESDTEIGGLHMTRLTAAIAPAVALTAAFTWNGTLTVTTPDTTAVAVGNWIWLNADAQWFQIASITPNTSVTLVNPSGKTVPSGVGGSSKAVQSFPVETTVDWLAAGKIGLDGVVYHYASKTNTSFEGITYILHGEVTPGALRLHRVASAILDLNRIRTALDVVRQAMLLDYAEGENLNALGRNLGVDRLPSTSGDARFREIVKALAYNPKGTLLGLELALNGLVGAGNYALYENLQQYPCTVFIRLLGAAATDAQSTGKAYLAGSEEVNCTNPAAIPLSHLLINRGGVHSIYFKPEDRLTDCRIAFPSADLISEYTGAGLTPVWTFQGVAPGDEGTKVVLYTGDPDGGTHWLLPTATARYVRGLRGTSKAISRLEIVAKNLGGNDAIRNMAFTLTDGTRCMSVFLRSTSGIDVCGFAAGLTGPFTPLSLSILPTPGVYHTYTLEKDRDVEWRLYVDGNLVDRVPYASGSSSGGVNRAVFGASGGSPATVAGWIIKQASVWVNDDTDLASARGTGGVFSAPNLFKLNSYTPLSDDVGKTFLFSGLTAVTPGGGRNNGRWLITARSGTQVTLGPIPQIGAILAGGAFPTRITVPLNSRQFQYPDDLGNSATISGSTLGNNGTWVIQRLLDPSTLVDFSSWASHQSAQTNVCEVTGAAFTPETGLGWSVSPNFASEVAVRWSLPNSIDVTGGNSISLRRALPTLDSGVLKVLVITYSALLSADILVDSDAVNAIIQEVPELWWRYYPLYLADPLGFVRAYLDDITAAGVIPEFQIV